MAERFRSEWQRRFREGERVRLYRGYRTGRGAAIWLVVGLAVVVAEVTMIAREAGIRELLALPIMAAMGVFATVHEWGRAAHSALQLADDRLLVWDWRNREWRFAYRGIDAVAFVKRFPLLRTVRVCGSPEDGTASPEWRTLLTWPGRSSAACEVAEELARRAELTLRSEGLWARPYVGEVPPVLFWE